MKGRKQGFTLVELSIVLVIIGIVISIVATVVPSLLQSSKIRQNWAILDKVDYAMDGYISFTGRAPCPDVDGDGYEDRNDAGTTDDPTDDTCSAYDGDLPYLTIGLSNGNDVWHNPIRYAVYADLIATSKSTLCSKLNEFHDADYDSSLLYTGTGADAANQAYLIGSGGAKDLDGGGGYFDGANQPGDMGFENPDAIITTDYDDMIKMVSFTYLSGRQCTGGGGTGGGTGSTASGEAAYTDGCTNGIDDDGDGYYDCDDQDCVGVSPCGSGTLTITTSSLPSGTVGQDDYEAVIQAAGGVTPYQWTLASAGSPALDLYLHPYTGYLTGEIDQCPQTDNYDLTIRVTDSTPSGGGGPLTAETTLNLAVVADLSISGPGDIEWNDSAMEVEYSVNDGHLGSITCSIDGDTGFSVSWDSGEEACVLTKEFDTLEGYYNIEITAQDATCSDNDASTGTIPIHVTAAGGGIPIPSEDFVSRWQLSECNWADEGVVDSMGLIPNGTANNGATTIPGGKVCRAGYFDGDDDYVDMGDGDFFNDYFGTGMTDGFTVAMWLKPMSLSSDNRTNHLTYNCFFAKASDSNNDNLEFGINLDSTIHVYIDASGKDTQADFGAAGDIVVGAWNFVAISYDLATGFVTVNINGTDYLNDSSWAGGGVLDQSVNSTVTLGATLHGNSNIDCHYHGMIDEVMMFNRPLTSTEIGYLLNQSGSVCSTDCLPGALYYMDETGWSGVEGEVVDAEVSLNHGTAYNGATTTAAGLGRVCRGGEFDATGGNNSDRVEIPYHVVNGLEDYTVALWIKTVKTGTQGLVTGNRSDQDNAFLLYLPNATTISGYLDGSARSYSTGGVNLADGAWHHIAWVREGTTGRMYLDGNSIGTGTVSQNPVLLSEGGLWLATEQDSVGGGWASGSQDFEGVMDEVYFYSRALSGTEINTLATNWDPTGRTCP